MRYMLLIYTDPVADAKMTAAEGEMMSGEYGTFTQELVDKGVLVAGDPLQGADTATTVRLRNGSATTTDGPFAETKEVLGGYYIVECDDLDGAIEWAAKIPGARTGSIEVRPIREM